jgi:hypothetical protein
MSEYRWYVRKAWIGVKTQPPYVWHDGSIHPGIYDDVLVGVIRRSGWVMAVGHFCCVKITYKGRWRLASGAEDRIYPFHSIKLDPGEEPGKLELVHLGFCNDGNTAAFRNKKGEIVEIIDAGCKPDNTRLIPKERWKDDWKDEVRRSA